MTFPLKWIWIMWHNWASKLDHPHWNLWTKNISFLKKKPTKKNITFVRQETVLKAYFHHGRSLAFFYSLLSNTIQSLRSRITNVQLSPSTPFFFRSSFHDQTYYHRVLWHILRCCQLLKYLVQRWWRRHVVCRRSHSTSHGCERPTGHGERMSGKFVWL